MPKTLDIETKSKIKVVPIALAIIFLTGGVAMAFAALMLVTKGSKEFSALVKSFQNLSAIESLSLKMDFTMKPEKREASVPSPEFPAEAKSLRAAYETMFMNLPAEFFITFNLQSDIDSLRTKSFQDTNNYINARGAVSFGGTKLSGQAEVIKLKDEIYFNLHEAPYLFFGYDYTALKDQWVRFQPEDTVSEASYFINFYENADEKAADYYKIFESAIDEKFITAKIDTLREKGTNFNHYVITFDYTKYPAFLRSLKMKLGEKFNMPDEFEIIKGLEDVKNKKAVENFSKTQLFEIFIDPSSNYIRKMVYTGKLVPPGKARKFQGRQIRVTLTLTLDKINQKIVIAKPASAISLDEAVSVMTGKGLNSVQFNHQLRNIEYLRRSLTSYAGCKKLGFPETLDELLQTRKSIAEKAVKNTDSTPQNDFSYDYCDDYYLKYYADTPLASYIPRDVYSNTGYNYRKVVDDYELFYEIKNKPVPSSSDIYSYHYYNDSYYTEKVAEGMNTADSKTLSREGKDIVDSDFDGLTDSEENSLSTDPYSKDTDNDSFYDGEEVRNGYNPLGPGKMNEIGAVSPEEKNVLMDSQARSRDKRRILDIRQMATRMELEEANKPGSTLLGCDAAHVAAQLCADTSGKILFSRYKDPSNPSGVCLPESSGVCEYSVSRKDGGFGAKTNDYEVCFWLERDTTDLKAGLNRATVGGILESGCR